MGSDQGMTNQAHGNWDRGKMRLTGTARHSAAGREGGSQPGWGERESASKWEVPVWEVGGAK